MLAAEGSSADDAAVGKPAVVAFSTSDWGGLYNVVEPRLVGLARRGWRVLHSNGALSVWDRYGSAWRRAGWLGRLEVLDGVLVERQGRFPPRWQTWERWDRLVVGLHARRLQRAALRAGSQATIGYLFHPDFYPYLRALDPTYVVFQVIDNYAHQPGWTAEAGRWLAALVERADLLLANNPTQAGLLPGSGPRKARILPNAVDFARVEAGAWAPCPPDLERIPTPRIGYIGTLCPNVDFPMIEAVARARPEWHWVLVGPAREPEGGEYAENEAAQRRCEALPNVHLLGYRAREEVPAYLHWMQVNTLSYRLSAGPMTQAAYPFKVLECLGTGRPVVSAAMPEVMRHRDVMDFADTPAEWIVAIDRALTKGGVGTREERLAVARANTWENRLDDLDKVLREMVRSHPR